MNQGRKKPGAGNDNVHIWENDHYFQRAEHWFYQIEEGNDAKLFPTHHQFLTNFIKLTQSTRDYVDIIKFHGSFRMVFQDTQYLQNSRKAYLL